MIAKIRGKSTTICILSILGLLIFICISTTKYIVDHEFPEIPFPRDNESCMGFGVIELVQNYHPDTNELTSLKTRMERIYLTDCIDNNYCFDKYLLQAGWNEVENNIYCDNEYTEIIRVINTPYIVREFIKNDNQQERDRDKICILEEEIDNKYSYMIITIIHPSIYSKITNMLEPK